MEVDGVRYLECMNNIKIFKIYNIKNIKNIKIVAMTY
jgi:hypothetical protein